MERDRDVPGPWAPATFPVEPRGEASLTEVADAYLTACAEGALRSVRAPRRWHSGAAYTADGELVPESQKVTAGGPWAQADPPHVVPDPDAEMLPGRWLYGGQWLDHFGHFFLETLTTLWPEPAGRVDGLVFHTHSRRGPRPTPWQRRLLRIAGYGGLPVRLVSSEPLRVERLTVPTRPVVVDGWALPEVNTVWDRMASAVDAAAGGRRIYLSRTAFHQAQPERARRVRRSAPEWDRALDAAFAGAGFEVVAPEQLPVADQLRLAASADVLAGPSGTALHLSAFAAPGSWVIEVGDDRLRRRHSPMQRIVDAARGHLEAHLPYAPGDLGSIGRSLDGLL